MREGNIGRGILGEEEYGEGENIEGNIRGEGGNIEGGEYWGRKSMGKGENIEGNIRGAILREGKYWGRKVMRGEYCERGESGRQCTFHSQCRPSMTSPYAAMGVCLPSWTS